MPVIALAAVTLVITPWVSLGPSEAVSRAVSVLVVSCPCALGLATPLAVVNAVSAGSRRGLLIRGGAVLERAGDLGRVAAFDKTGTLTLGRPTVEAIVPAAGFDDASVLELASALEAAEFRTQSPQQYVRTAAERGVSAVTAEAAVREPGLGVSGTVGDTAALVGSESLLASHGVAVSTFTRRTCTRRACPSGASSCSLPAVEASWA